MTSYEKFPPEENPFMFLVADITHRCNMTCKNCYIPNRDIPDMDFNKFVEFIDRLPKKTLIRLIGAEPTMNRELPLYIQALKERGHRTALLSNGLRFSHKKYLAMIKDAGLENIYVSLNGVDNDDWYEEIDEMRCASKKLRAVQNIIDSGIRLETGTIIVKGINEEAPARLNKLLFETHDVKDTLIRIKNVGQIGRHMDDADGSFTMDELIKICADGFGISEEFIHEYKNSGRNPLNHEPNTCVFPLDGIGRSMLRGAWVKITNWIVHEDSPNQMPDPGSIRRGRITEDFMCAPFFEDVKENEFGY